MTGLSAPKRYKCFSGGKGGKIELKIGSRVGSDIPDLNYYDVFVNSEHVGTIDTGLSHGHTPVTPVEETVKLFLLQLGFCWDLI